MATSVFADKEQQPADKMVEQALQSSFVFWEEIIRFLGERHGIIASEWKFYSKKAGWCLKLANAQGKNLLFLSPCDGWFIATVNISERIMEKIFGADLQQTNKELIQSAKVYAEGISLLFPVRNERDLRDVKLVLDAKNGESAD